MSKQFKIINNKKIDLTNDEWQMYQKICRSYDRQNFQGEELFKDHFETNGDGIITFVKPPQGRYTSMEVYCFLTSIMHNQHLRLMHEQVDALVRETKEKINQLFKEMKDDSK